MMFSPDMRPHDDPSWTHYGSTILELFGTTRLRIDLRQPVDADVRAALAAEGLVRPFAVLTASKPCVPPWASAPPAPGCSSSASSTQRRSVPRPRDAATSS